MTATVVSQSNTCIAATDQKKFVKQILNLDDRLYTLQKYVVCKSRVEIGHTFTEISLNLSDITDFL